MRLNWRGSSRAEDRFETWIKQRYQERVLAEGTTAIGPCPDEDFLRELAHKSKRIALSDPRVDHAASCPVCMNRLFAFRSQTSSRRRRLAFATAVAACLVMVVFVVLARHRAHSRPSAANLAAVSETVNLWNVGTFRGQQPSLLQAVSLPAAQVRVTIILPRFSEPGKYVVAVTRDQAGSEVIAGGTAMSNKNGDQQEVSVDLDLRRVNAGKYFLATTHEQDQSSYYYPLHIR